MYKKIVLASHNQGKIKEFREMFSAFNIDIIGADQLGLPEPEETEDSFEGNAILEARHACEITAMPCLADDSGLAVTAMNGAPGVYSARWAGADKNFDHAMEKIWDEISSHDNKTAQFIAVLALVTPYDEIIIGRGEVEGHITYPPRGKNGFGYDPIFIPENENQTFAEMGAKGKDQYSHRRRAFDRLIDQLPLEH